jgi:hypothetical protein
MCVDCVVASRMAKRRLGFFDVVEGEDFVADDLALLVTLAGHHQHIARFQKRP